MNIIISIIIILCFFVFLYFSLYINNSNTDNADIDENLITYKIHKPKIKQKKIIDKYNIKEFDVINNNILIHNKFKNELINYKQQKSYIQNIKSKILEQKKNSIQNTINKNTNDLIINELKEQNMNLSNTNNSIKLLLKNEFNDCLVDLHNNNIDKNQINKLLIDLKNTINDIITKIQLINNKLLDIDKSTELSNLYLSQIDLYNIQCKLYNTKFKFYKKINSKI